MGKMAINPSLEAGLKGFGVLVVLRPEQRIHVGLDQIVEHHVER